MEQLHTDAAESLVQTPPDEASLSSESLAEAQGPRRAIPERVLCTLLASAILIKLGFLAFYSVRLRWVMDEFGQGTSGKLVDVGLYTHIDPIKTALPLLASHVALTYGGSLDGVLFLLRFFTTLAALVTIGATAYAAHRLHRSWLWTLFAVFTLLSFSNFLEQAFQVRSDSFSVALCVLSFACFLRATQTPRSLVLSGVFAGGAFLCTQKAAYFIVALGVGQVIRTWAENGIRPIARDLLFFGLGALASLGAYCIGFGGLNAAEVFVAIFLSPFKMTSHLLSADLFPNIRRYITQTLERNTLAYAVCILGICWTFIRALLARNPTRFNYPKIEPRAVSGALVAAIITTSVFLHAQPWPYVFVLCMPFLAVFSPFVLRDVPLGPQRLLAFILFLALATTFHRNVEVLPHDNQLQLQIARQAEGMLGPNDRYFDGVGMLPTRNIAGRHPWWWWDTPTLVEIGRQPFMSRDSALASMLRDGPKLWILNYRLFRMQRRLTPIWDQGTVKISPYIRMSGRIVPAGLSVAFTNLWSGTYALVDRRGRRSDKEVFNVGHRQCTGSCTIPQGSYAVSAHPTETRFLLPADIKLNTSLPNKQNGRDLYEDVYDF